MISPFYKMDLRTGANPFTLGGTTAIQLNRDSLLEGIRIIITGTIATAAATASIEGLPALLQSITLRGSSSGTNYQPINSLSGPDLYELHQFRRGAVPVADGALGSTGFFRIEIPITFRQWWFQGTDSYRTCLPAFQMSDLTLTMVAATQAQVDTNGTPTFALTSASIYVIQEESYRESVPKDFENPAIYLQELFEVTQWDVQLVTNPNFIFEIPAGGLYSYLLLRSFSAANVKQADSGSAPFTNGSTQQITLYDLAKRVKKDCSFMDLRGSNINDVVDTPIVGNACFVYGHEQNQLFDTTTLNKTTANVNMNANITTATGSKVRIVRNRIFNMS